MNSHNVFLMNDTVSFALDANNIIVGFSANLKTLETEFYGQNIYSALKKLLVNKDFSNSKDYDEIVNKIKEYINKRQSGVQSVAINNLLKNNILGLNFELAIDVLENCEINALIKLSHVNYVETKEKIYESIFNEYDTVFDGFSNLIHIGKVIIDYSDGPNDRIYANEEVPFLLDIEKSPNNQYYVTDDESDKRPYTILRTAYFKSQLTQLLAGEVEYITYERYVNNKYLQVEIRVYKRDASNKPTILVGLMFDVSRYRQYNDLNQMKQIYDLAIKSGNLGIFYYNVERYGKSLFIANDIYANLIGLEPNELGLFKLEDFEESIITVEEDVTGKNDTKRMLGLLMEGRVDGTTDNILKVRNRKTKEELYLPKYFKKAPSSRIYSVCRKWGMN